MKRIPKSFIICNDVGEATNAVDTDECAIIILGDKYV